MGVLVGYQGPSLTTSCPRHHRFAMRPPSCLQKERYGDYIRRGYIVTGGQGKKRRRRGQQTCDMQWLEEYTNVIRDAIMEERKMMDSTGKQSCKLVTIQHHLCQGPGGHIAPYEDKAYRRQLLLHMLDARFTSSDAIQRFRQQVGTSFNGCSNSHHSSSSSGSDRSSNTYNI